MAKKSKTKQKSPLGPRPPFNIVVAVAERDYRRREVMKAVRLYARNLRLFGKEHDETMKWFMADFTTCWMNRVGFGRFLDAWGITLQRVHTTKPFELAITTRWLH